MSSKKQATAIYFVRISGPELNLIVSALVRSGNSKLAERLIDRIIKGKKKV